MFTILLDKVGKVVVGALVDDRGRVWSTTMTEKGRKEASDSLLRSLPIGAYFREERNEMNEKILDSLKRAVMGREFVNEYELVMDRIPSFHRKVYETLRKIPRGRVISYGELARASGSEGAARAVGNAMRDNPFPLIVPCHRVIKSNLELGGFGGGEDLKKRILASEGIVFKERMADKASLIKHGEV
ncbi:MAG TPA: methylated-DNA--[protein]-cysteine S-methyltransferase [Candidatus Bathyarchaeia archaeon]|nr:MAG: hypothetical protein A3K70_02210 [Candidatus Bathyarchaeota archaeon RBG_16_48_13]HJX23393.1 methylated-DNA--[protein]-cysteine S-methyltransferase [Candidatus Bathyarchaeia archaeon]